MSCHVSCGTCSGSTFMECLTCPSGASLVSGACFCDMEWDATCTYKTISLGLDVTLQSFYTVFFALVIFLYYLKTRLPYSYRIVTGLQALSLLIFSSKIYLYFENYFNLRYLAKSNGFFNYTIRIQTLSINHAIGPFVLFGCFFVVYLLGYYLTNAVRVPYKEYTTYLSQNLVHLLYTFYFFASRQMFYFIGAWINSLTFQPAVFIPFCIFAAVILLTLIKIFYDFHKDKLPKDEVYEPEILLYLMLQPAAMVGLPFVQNQIFYIFVYLVPLGLMLLIILINRNFEVFTKAKVLFYVVELLIAGLTVSFIMLPDPYRYYILLATIILAIVSIAIELIYVYYSGAELCGARSNKVYPESSLKGEDKKDPSEDDQFQESKFNKPKKKSAGTVPVSKKSYF